MPAAGDGSTPSVRASGAGGEDDALLFSNLKNLIKTIDELRDVGLQQYIKLPRIVAIGSQSTGKSSVIESIAGYDF